MFQTDWFISIEPSLHPWNKSQLFMVYDPFNMLLNTYICLYFPVNFCIYCHQGYRLVVYFFVISFSSFVIRVMQDTQNDFGSDSFSASFFKQFQKYSCLLFSKCFIKFTDETILSLSFVCRKVLKLLFLIQLHTYN